MKPAIYALALIQALVLIAMALGAAPEAGQMGRAIFGAYTALGALVAFAFTTPAILLARAGKSLPIAFALAATPLLILAIFYAARA